MDLKKSNKPSVKPANKAGKAPILSPEDLKDLMDNNNSESKINVLNKITTVYKTDEESSGANLNKNEVEIIEDIFRVLIKVAEKQVRIAFSDSIKSSATLPKDIALSLARDIDDVSIPILEASKILDETDLIEIISNTESITQLMAIARRQHVPENVSSALIDKNEEVAETLLKNFGSELSEETYSKILSKAGDSEVIVGAMVEKGTMPVTIMEKLLRHVSGEMRKKLDDQYQVVFESIAVKKEMEINLKQATARMMGIRTETDRKKKLLEHLTHTGKISPFIALTGGDYNMFEIAMARLSQLTLDKVRLLLGDQGGLGFSTLYKRIGMPESLFEATDLVLRSLQTLEAEQPMNKRRKFKAQEIVARMKILAGTRKINELDFLIDLVEQNNR